MHTTERLNAALAGRYVIDHLIGEGGMATVYLARDARHNRKVALKVLKPDLGAIVGVDRFLAEIQVTANLQHPNLLPLFDSGAVDNLLFYVMPYVQGESLRARIDREKQLPLDDAVRIASAVAGALDYAHRQGVIHRDLKPENILLSDGNPLVADFGIALAVSNAGGSRITQTGLSLGTPQYMSPEQATGDRVIDARSDLYSLGALTYEMLTGEPPHTGTTSQAVIARVLTEKPRSIRASRPTVPLHVEATVERALEKLPADRWASAKEFSEALTGARSLALTGDRMPATPGLTGVVRTLPITPERTPIVSGRGLVVGAAGIALAALAGGVGAVAMRETPIEPQARFVVTIPDSLQFVSARFRQLALSRDGSRAVFNFPANFPAPLYTRRTGEMQFDVIPGSDSARAMVISPNARHVLFWLEGENTRLMKVPIEGGSPVKIADSASVIGQGSWSDRDEVIFRRDDHLVLVSADGGPERIVAWPDTSLDQSALGWPEMLPGGKAALITIHHGPGNNPDSLFVGAVSLADGKVIDFGFRGLTPHFASGHLLYVRQDGQLFARPFDARRLRFSGDERVIAKDVSARTTTFPGAARQRGLTELAVSEAGTILFTDGGSTIDDGSGTGPNRRSIVVHSGRAPRWLKVPRLAYGDLRASPDGERLAVTIRDSADATREDVFIYFFATDQLKRFTRDGMSGRPVWSPDGKRVIWRVTNPSAKPVLRFYSMPWDESEPAAPVPGADGAESVEFPPPGGKFIAYVRGDSTATESPRTNSDIFIAPVDSPTASRPFAAGGTRERMPRFSPNGKWVAYVAHELPASATSLTQAPRLFVRPLPGPGGLTQVSIETGTAPLWSRDSRSLSYFSGGGGAPLVAARISESRGFEVTSRAEVFRRAPPGTGPLSPTVRTVTDILPNGSVVFLTNQPEQEELTPGAVVLPARMHLIAIVNWLSGAGNAPQR